MATINRTITTSDVDCGMGHSSSDTCFIRCEYVTDTSGIHANCGDAGKCYIDCNEERCLRDAMINATLSDSLEIIATSKECLIRSNIYLPYNGNATITVDTQGIFSDAIIKGAFIYSQSTNYIHFECNDPLKNDYAKDECRELNIFAADADYLSVTVNGADFMDGLIKCPKNSILEPSCIINASNALDIAYLQIQGGNGTMPTNVRFYGGTGNLFDNVAFFCKNDQQSIQYDKLVGTFNNTGECWVNTVSPTLTPTTSTPTTSTPTTSTPTTSMPTSADPTTSKPTKNPTPIPYEFCTNNKNSNAGKGFYTALNGNIPNENLNEKICEWCVCSDDYKTATCTAVNDMIANFSSQEKDDFMELCKLDEHCSFDQVILKPSSDSIDECGCQIFECEPLGNNVQEIHVALIYVIMIVIILISKY